MNSALKKNKLDTIHQPNRKPQEQLHFDDILYCHEKWDEIEEKVNKHQKNTKEDYYMENRLESLSTKHLNIFIRNPYFHTSRG